MPDEMEDVRRGPGRPPKEENKKQAVKLLRGYFPKDPDHPKHPSTGEPVKVERGSVIKLPMDEAKELLRKELAVVTADLLP